MLVKWLATASPAATAPAIDELQSGPRLDLLQLGQNRKIRMWKHLTQEYAIPAVNPVGAPSALSKQLLQRRSLLSIRYSEDASASTNVEEWLCLNEVSIAGTRARILGLR